MLMRIGKFNHLIYVLTKYKENITLGNTIKCVQTFTSVKHISDQLSTQNTQNWLHHRILDGLKRSIAALETITVVQNE